MDEEYLPYQSLEQFSKIVPALSVEDFKRRISNGIDLFSTGADFDFDELRKKIEIIQKSLPAVKHIFQKPIIHLIEEEKIVPVEAAGSITSNTVHHLSSHPELWDNIDNGKLIPRKLLSKTYEDNYAIYENIVVVKYVDKVLSFCRRNLSALRNLMYASKTLNINLLDRDNHRNYYLALGQLQAGYIKNYSFFYSEALECEEQLSSIYSVLTSRLHRPIYVHCHKYHGKFSLHKTNILGMQKDYHKVYVSFRSLFHENKEEEEENTNENPIHGYYIFVESLALFSILNYGFETNETTSFDFHHLDADFSFRQYCLHVTGIEDKGLLLTFKKEKTFAVFLNLTKGKAESRDRNYSVSDNDIDSDLILSIHDIESFRKIQQILLEGMIYSDTKREVCPFCGEDLVYDKKLHGYLCHSCRETIQEKICPETQQSYFETNIFAYKPKAYGGNSEFEKQKYLESLYRYRNITKIDNKGFFLCPKCGKEHIG